jgi:undecaprenyl-diphosphatase
MAELGSTANPDLELLYGINGLAAETPHWFDRVAGWVGEYGIMAALALLMVWCWWSARKRQDAPAAVAALLWAPLAAGIALLANIPIRGFVERPRPFVDRPGLEVLVDGKTDYSFVSDHSTAAMAIGVGIFLANRRFGLVGIGLAALEGFCRIYMGVHYPTDVIGGFALGTAVVLLLAPPALALLALPVRAVTNSRARWLVRSPGAGISPGGDAGEAAAGAGTGDTGTPELPTPRQKGLAA